MNINRDKNKEERKHLVTILWRMYLLIGIEGITIIGIVSYGFITGSRMNTMYAPLVDAAMEIMLEVTTAHLSFEEILIGGRTESAAYYNLYSGIYFTHRGGEFSH